MLNAEFSKPMSNTAKTRLQVVLTSLYSLFATVHTDDRPELVKELRDYLTLQNAACKAPGYGNHTNRATGAS